jgi:ABC-type branched-subunit amino acid transport system substrate-binding protein
LPDHPTLFTVKAAKLVQQDQVDVALGGVYSSTRQAIKGPVVVQATPTTARRSRRS